MLYYCHNDIPQDDEKALQWFTQAALQGHAKAQNLVGVMYQDGLGIDKADTVKAIEFYLLSAMQGYVEAEYNLAFMYLKGIGVEPRVEAGIAWLKSAAGKDYQQAQYLLGKIYKKGMYGVKENIEEAVKWYKQAALREHPKAQNKLDQLLRLQLIFNTAKNMDYH